MESLEQRARRNTIVRGIARQVYASEDVNVLDTVDYTDHKWLDNRESGYWVYARVWVSEDEVEDELANGSEAVA